MVLLYGSSALLSETLTYLIGNAFCVNAINCFGFEMHRLSHWLRDAEKIMINSHEFIILQKKREEFCISKSNN